MATSKEPADSVQWFNTAQSVIRRGPSWETFLFLEPGLRSGFQFKYQHYGPYSEELWNASRTAAILRLLNQTKSPASWGGLFSTLEDNIPQIQTFQNQGGGSLRKL